LRRKAVYAFASASPLPDDAAMVAAAALPATALASVRTFDVGTGRLHERVDEGFRHLHAHGKTFRRAGQAVEIKHVPEPSIVALSKPSQMRLALSSACSCYTKKNDKQTGQVVDVSCDPPEGLAKTMVEKVVGPEDHLDPLDDIVTAPFLDAAGEVVQVHGAPRYDAATRLWLDPAGVDFKPVLDAECTRDDALKALEVLSFPISRYDFASETDKTVALASMLLPFVRPSITLAPGIAIEAPLKGSGKTKLASLPAILATGAAPALIASPGRADELDKRIIASLLGGKTAVVIDNIADSDETWGTDTLCAAITANLLNLRPLGSSNAQTVTNRATVTVTGNNIGYPGDVTRRFLVCRIEPRHASPHKRAFAFDPDAEVLQNRTKYVHAALTILRAYSLAGSPPQNGAALGSFGEFTRRVRDALMWLGLPDVAEASAEDKGDASPEQAALADVLDAWANVPTISTGSHKAGVIVKVAEDEARNGRSGLRDALTAACGRFDSGLALGQWLGRNKGRPANGLLFNGGKDRQKVMVWSLDRLNVPAAQPAPAQPATEDDDPIGTTDTAAIEAQHREHRIAAAQRAFTAIPMGAERPN
jgi:putative DNA primase/helicase